MLLHSSSVAIVGALAGALWISSAYAQEGESPSPSVSAAQREVPTPRRADGHPDLTGIWRADRRPRNENSAFTQLAGPRIGLAQGTVGGAPEASGNGPVETEMGARDGSVVHLEQDATQIMRSNPDKPWYKPQYWGKVRELDRSGTRTGLDPGFGCRNPGIARLGAPGEILQDANRIVLLYADFQVREIPIDGRPLPSPSDYEGIKPMGVASGHWDGDTLIITTVDPTPNWLGPAGWFYSEEVKFTERLRREGNRLTYDLTVEDPVLIKPWVLPTRELVLNADPKAIMVEPDACAERDSEHIVGEGETPDPNPG